MDHVAIMRKSWKLTEKILTGEKKIESRWYKSKYRPWGNIKAGDTVYFKDSGGPVYVRALVAKVKQFSGLTPLKVGIILGKYGEDDGIAPKDLDKFYNLFKDKKYCLLIFLEGPESVDPFDIDKKGFGTMSAWVTINDIKEIALDG